MTWSYISLATSMDLAEPRRRKQPIKNSCESGKDGENMGELKGQVDPPVIWLANPCYNSLSLPLSIECDSCYHWHIQRAMYGVVLSIETLNVLCMFNNIGPYPVKSRQKLHDTWKNAESVQFHRLRNVGNGWRFTSMVSRQPTSKTRLMSFATVGVLEPWPQADWDKQLAKFRKTRPIAVLLQSYWFDLGKAQNYQNG